MILFTELYLIENKSYYSPKFVLYIKNSWHVLVIKPIAFYCQSKILNCNALKYTVFYEDKQYTSQFPFNISNFVFICVNTFCMFCVGWTWAWSSGSWPSRWAPNPWGSQGGPGGRSLRGPWGGSSSRPWGTARQGKFTR